jgi:hypothetical protein
MVRLFSQGHGFSRAVNIALVNPASLLGCDGMPPAARDACG